MKPFCQIAAVAAVGIDAILLNEIVGTGVEAWTELP